MLRDVGSNGGFTETAGERGMGPGFLPDWDFRGTFVRFGSRCFGKPGTPLVVGDDR
jgi:hypothetical protein